MLKILKRAMLFLLAPFSLSACHYTLLNPKGRIAADEKQLLIITFFLLLLVVVPVIVLLLSFAWRYRAGNTKATYLPNWQHNARLELIWWSIPCVIILILGALTWFSSQRLDPYQPLREGNKKALVIQAISLEWKWLFIYPEQNIASLNFIQVPVGVPLHFYITAEGPMNAFQIPQLGGQIYAMAGMQTQLYLIADLPGVYRGVATNFSGSGFSDMTFRLRAGSQAEFDQWVRTVQQAPEKLTFTNYQRLSRAGVDRSLKYYSSTNKELFETIVMKGMMPMPIPAGGK